MGRLVLVSGVFATLMAALHPAPARAQAQPAPGNAAPHAAPARKPWREAMERAPAPESERPSNRAWYGWQTLLVDLSAVGLVALTGEDMAIGVAGLVVFGLGSPAVHAAYGNSTPGVISFSMRASALGLLFLGGAFLSTDFFDDDSDDTRETIGVAAVIGSLAGALAAVIIDASVLAFDERPREQQRTSVAPWFDPRRGSYGVRFALSL